jgi:hypothetical protein
MKALPAYPSLYQINTRVWLTELSRALGKRATLDDIPDAELDRLAELGFDWVWFLSVWQTGPAAQQVSRSNAGWRKEFQETLQQGFDYAYDKRLYDRLREGHARPVREHFYAGLDYQNKLARFLENHDEPRAAATFSPGVHEAAAVITFLSPGLRFFHQGQFEGRKKRISPHLVRGPEEPVDERVKKFYDRLLAVLRRPVVRNGDWQLLECVPAWDGNWTWDCFLAFAWQGTGNERLVVTVNYAPNQSQCHVRPPFADLGNRKWRSKDLLGDATYDWHGNDLQERGLYLDESPWSAHVFSMTKVKGG